MTTRSVTECPEARSAGLLTEQVGDELVIFDGETNEAHALKPLAAAVFAAADGATTTAGLAVIASTKLGQVVEVADVEVALAELDERSLLVDADPIGISRRRMLQVSGAAAAGVLVTSAVAPAFAAAASSHCNSNPGSAPGGWSDMAILFTDGHGHYYQAKWDGPNNAPDCGTFALGGCGSNWPPSGYTVTLLSSCPTGLTFSFGQSAGTVKVNMPAGYTLVGYMVHNGTYGCSRFVTCNTGNTGCVTIGVVNP